MSTGIEWTDETWNPTRGCSRVSEGCRNCYAERVAARFAGRGQPYDGLVFSAIGGRGPRWTGKVRLVPEKLAEPLVWRKPRRVFVNSMSDLFHEKLSNEEIAAVFGVMAAAPQHQFQVLTKRPERMREWFADLDLATIEKFKHLALEGRIEEYFAPERTAPVAGWPGYFVTSRGRVLSDRKGPRHDLKPMLSGEAGHCRVMLYRGEGRDEAERPLVHRIVLEAFDRLAAPGEQGRHIDGNPENNALWNLRWGTQSDNWNDRRRHGNGRSYHKLTNDQVQQIRSQHASGASMSSLAAAFDVSATQVKNIVSKRQWVSSAPTPWPLHWVWLGVSVEDQATADERIPLLLETPAAIRFISYEPALGPVDLGLPRTYLVGATARKIYRDHGGRDDIPIPAHLRPPPSLDWVIAGSESGPGARPAELDWFRQTRDQCAAAGVPFFFKQWVGGRGLDSKRRGVHHDGTPGRKVSLPVLDGSRHEEWPR